MSRLLQYRGCGESRPRAVRRKSDSRTKTRASLRGLASTGTRDSRPAEQRSTGQDSGTIYVVDADPAVRSSLRWLVAHLDVHFVPFSRGEDLLAVEGLDRRCCVVTDVALPGMSGLDLVRQLMARSGGKLPVIVLASHSDIPTAVAALEAGAVDFFEKPFGGRALARRIEEALRMAPS